VYLPGSSSSPALSITKGGSVSSNGVNSMMLGLDMSIKCRIA